MYLKNSAAEVFSLDIERYNLLSYSALSLILRSVCCVRLAKTIDPRCGDLHVPHFRLTTLLLLHRPARGKETVACLSLMSVELDSLSATFYCSKAYGFKSLGFSIRLTSAYFLTFFAFPILLYFEGIVFCTEQGLYECSVVTGRRGISGRRAKALHRRRKP